MAITVSGAVNDAVLRIEWRDYRGETVVQHISLDPSLDPTTDIIPMLTALDGLSNAIMTKVTFITGVGFTGMNVTPGTGLQPLVAAREILTFQKVNPVNALKTVSKGVGIPAYADALVNTAGGTPYHPVTTDTGQNALIAALEAGLNFKGADGVFYPGSFTYVNAESGFITVPSETDGLPG